MAYLLVGLLVLVIVGTAVTLVVRSAKRQGRERGEHAAADASGGAGLPRILATDRGSPLGDTSEHAGEHSGGETVADPEAERRRG